MKLHVNLSPNRVLDYDLREYSPAEGADACVIGTGAARRRLPG